LHVRQNLQSCNQWPALSVYPCCLTFNQEISAPGDRFDCGMISGNKACQIYKIADMNITEKRLHQPPNWRADNEVTPAGSPKMETTKCSQMIC
jgi:hypothetical protein